jgi:hypothetical protein
MNRPRTNSVKDRLEEVRTTNVGVTPSTLRHTASTIRNERVQYGFTSSPQTPGHPCPPRDAGTVAVITRRVP